MNSFGIFFLVIQLFFLFLNPRYFFLLYILFITEFLGFISNEILIFNYDAGFFILNILMISSFFIKYPELKNVDKKLRFFLWLIIIMYVFALINPIYSLGQPFQYSLVSSKEFSAFFLLHYLIVYHKKIRYEYLLKILNFLGYFYCIIFAIFLITEQVPPEYFKEQGNIEINYPTLMSLFLYLKASSKKTIIGNINFIIIVLIWIFGMSKEGHLAIMLTTTLGVFLIWSRFYFLRFFQDSKSFIKLLIISIIVIMFGFLYLPMNDYLLKLLRLPEFESRAIYNKPRIELIEQRPLFGYGFVNKNIIKLGENVYTESLSFIDSGYIDLLGKFGIIGTSFYLISLISLIFDRKTTDFYSISLKLFILQFLFVNLTWSVFSFRFGLISLSLAIFLYFINNR